MHKLYRGLQQILTGDVVGRFEDMSTSRNTIEACWLHWSVRFWFMSTDFFCFDSICQCLHWGSNSFQFIPVKPVSSRRRRNLRTGVVEWTTTLRVLGRRPENDDSNLIDGERQGSRIPGHTSWRSRVFQFDRISETALALISSRM